MQSTDKPSKFSIPWANSGTKNTIPTASQIGITAGAASLTDGFPPLTFTPVAAGGVPPAGADFNGILNQVTANDRWTAAGGGFPYDSAFSTDIGGYPKGANVSRSDGAGFWISQQDNNTVDPETDTTGKWLPSGVTGAASVTMTSANVTLTNLQAGFDVIILSGTLTANLNLVFPTWKKSWTIINNCSGAFTVTAKTASGTGVSIPATVATQVSGDGTNIQTSSGIAIGSVTPSKLSTGAPSWDLSGNLQFNSGYGSVATAYGCRAWVNFNGTGTVAIRGSGNVSSITDNGVGLYTANFTTPMPDVNYSTSFGISSDNAGNNRNFYGIATKTVSAYPMNLNSSGVAFDGTDLSLAIFR